MRRKHQPVYWGSFVLDWFKYLQDNDLSSSDYRVLFFLCSKMKVDDNTVYVKQIEIAQLLNMDKGNVSKSIKKLRLKQFIVKTKSGYMINPHLFYVSGRSFDVREELRMDFDYLIMNDELTKGQHRFSLNEDEHKLEVHYPPFINSHDKTPWEL